MITKVTSANKDKYSRLFEKARETLGITNVDELNSLDAFFTRIRDLANEDPLYTVLPLDEEPFAIDANKRTIEIPKNFSSHGLCVEGDHRAEVVFFSIDRYFDSIDLDKQSIFIQWELSDGTVGVSPNYLKDVTSQEGKLIFGWVLDSEITSVPGKIKFAIRFYTFNEDTEITYSFSTLPAIANINSSLNLDIENKLDDLQIINGDTLKIQMLERLENSNAAGISIPQPPIMASENTDNQTMNIACFVVEKTDTNKTIYKGYADTSNLVERDGNKLLCAYAETEGTANVHYSWKQYDPINNEFITIVNTDENTLTGIDYITVAEAGHEVKVTDIGAGELQTNGTFYYYDIDDNKYYIITDNMWDDFKDVEGNYDIDNIYRKVGFLKIPTQPGTYRVIANTVQGINQGQNVTSEAIRNPHATIYFFGPRAITKVNKKDLISPADGTVSYEPYVLDFTQSNEANTTLNNIILETDVQVQNLTSPLGNPALTWDATKLNQVADEVEEHEFVWVKDGSSTVLGSENSLIITPTEGSFAAHTGYYTVTVKNTRNGQESEAKTNRYRLTYKPEDPIISSSLPSTATLNETELSLTVTPVNDFDTLHCSWEIYNNDDDTYTVIGESPAQNNTGADTYNFIFTPTKSESPKVEGGELLFARVWSGLNNVLSAKTTISSTGVALLK